MIERGTRLGKPVGNTSQGIHSEDVTPAGQETRVANRKEMWASRSTLTAGRASGTKQYKTKWRADHSDWTVERQKLLLSRFEYSFTISALNSALTSRVKFLLFCCYLSQLYCCILEFRILKPVAEVAADIYTWTTNPGDAMPRVLDQVADTLMIYEAYR